MKTRTRRDGLSVASVWVMLLAAAHGRAVAALAVCMALCLCLGLRAATWTPITTWVNVAQSGGGIAVDPVTGDVWAIRHTTHEVAKLSADGTLILTIGGFGTAPGKLVGPGDVAVAPNGDLLVTDVGNNRVQRFDSNGNLLGTFGDSSLFVNPLGITTDADGNVYVADVFKGLVRKFSPSGSVLKTYSLGTKPFGIGIDQDGKLWVCEQGGTVWKADPTTGDVELTFQIPGPVQTVSLALDNFGQVHFLNFSANEVLTYTLNGTVVDILGPLPSQVLRMGIGATGQLYVSGHADIWVFTPRGFDTDGDELSDENELIVGTDPNNPDTDGDGLNDFTEVDTAVNGCPDPLNPDSDGDTLLDGAEVLAGTDPCKADSDGDTLSDKIDPAPLDPEVTSGVLEDATRLLCACIQDIDLSLFNGPNDNANAGRRNALANRACGAANAIADGDIDGAIDELASLLAKIDGESPPPDWMDSSDTKTALADDVGALIALLLSS